MRQGRPSQSGALACPRPSCQRQASKQRPSAEAPGEVTDICKEPSKTRENTTQLLVQDVEALRAMLGIERWLATGGSWGTTLALAYGQTHPEACLGFILRGIFLGSTQEIDWFIHGMGLFYPDAHDDFVAWVEAPERAEILAAYKKKLFGEDHGVQLAIARR